MNKKSNTVKWPTLNDRLNNPLLTREEAVKQLKEAGITLSPLALKYIKVKS